MHPNIDHPYQKSPNTLKIDMSCSQKRKTYKNRLNTTQFLKYVKKNTWWKILWSLCFQYTQSHILASVSLRHPQKTHLGTDTQKWQPQTRKNKQAARNQPQAHCKSSKNSNTKKHSFKHKADVCAWRTCACAWYVPKGHHMRARARQYIEQYRSILINIRRVRSIRLIGISADQIFNLPTYRLHVSKLTKYISKQIINITFSQKNMPTSRWNITMSTTAFIMFPQKTHTLTLTLKNDHNKPGKTQWSC